MTIPAGDAVLSSEWLSRTLEGRVVSATRIGVEHGFSGRVHRVVAETPGGSTSFIVKQDGSAQVERELLFRSHMGERLRDCIAKCFGGLIDSKSGGGVLVLEDVTPAEQGDVLHGCTHAQAEAVVRALARVHGSSWAAIPPGLPRWRTAPMEPDAWADRLDRARQRFPSILTGSVLAELRDLPEQVASAVAQLTRGPVSWIQVDAHLDNVLWRPAGSVVLLDWCSAAIGPPAVDLARFIVEGVVDASQPERVNALMSTYAEERRIQGARAEPIELRAGFALALPPLLQGAIGWAGRQELELTGRPGALCESFLRSLCDWRRKGEYRLH